MHTFKALTLMALFIQSAVCLADPIAAIPEAYGPHFDCLKSICNADTCPDSDTDHVLALVEDKNYVNGKNVVYTRIGAFAYPESGLPVLKAAPTSEGPIGELQGVYEIGIVKLEGVTGLKSPLFVKYGFVLSADGKTSAPTSTVVPEATTKKLLALKDAHFKISDQGTLKVNDITSDKEVEQILLAGAARKINTVYTHLFLKKTLLKADVAPSYDEMIDAAQSIGAGCKGIQNPEFQTFLEKKLKHFSDEVEKMRKVAPEGNPALQRGLRQA